MDGSNYRPWTALEVCQVFRMFFHLRSKNELTFDMLHSPDAIERAAMEDPGRTSQYEADERRSRNNEGGGAFSWPGVHDDEEDE